MSILEDLKVAINCKEKRIDEINIELSSIEGEIDKLASNSPDEDIKNMLQNALLISSKRQELDIKSEVLTKALSVTRQELKALLDRLQEVEIEDYFRQLTETSEECNETLERLKTQFKTLKHIASKLSTLPIKRQPITYSYQANLPRLRIMGTTVFVEEDLRSSLDSIKWND
jgi:chromosome segregation ATPase